jgi:small conductance mechanosensitive channel
VAPPVSKAVKWPKIRFNVSVLNRFPGMFARGFRWRWIVRHRLIHSAFLLGWLLAVCLNSGALAQDLPPAQGESNASAVESPAREQFFADVLVRGKPVFQVGSLENLGATDRAQQINRRIAGLLNQEQPLDPVTVKFDEQQELATLQVNNRVIMTVTSQDALDFDTTISALAEEWADRLNTALVETNLAVDVAQRLQGASQQVIDNIFENLPSILGAILVLAVTGLVGLGVRQAAIIWAENTEGDRNTEILVGRLCYGAIWVLGTIIALGVLGLNFAALLGTLGLTSVAIGFSLKDVLSNYISGLILLAARPFRIGDQVVIDQYEGTITQIQLRATTMQTYDGRLVYIPNQEVFQSSITNNTASPIRRSSVMVGIDYDADIDRTIQVILDNVIPVEGVEANPPPVVLVRELAASTVNLEIWFWVNSRRRSFLQVTSHVLTTIKRSLQAANIEMPTDIYTIMLKNGSTPAPRGDELLPAIPTQDRPDKNQRPQP